MIKLGLTLLAAITLTTSLSAIPASSDLDYPEYNKMPGDIALSRSAYYLGLKGFWLGQCIANFTGLTTEGMRNEKPFYTEANWGEIGKDGSTIEFVLADSDGVWNADDDTDIEYMYQEAMLGNQTSKLSPENIRDAWMKHIRVDDKGEPERIWVSNKRAWDLMKYEGLLPPATSFPENNGDYCKIDAQLTTEIFGLFAPVRQDVALEIAHLPIRTTAYLEAEWIAEFYVIMHSLASSVDPSLSMKDKMFWLAEQARKRIPESYASDMYDFVKQSYENNPDKNDWAKTRDEVYERYQINGEAGYGFRTWTDAGINYAASIISLFYGEGDYKRTVKIASLSGWDSDNPAATWGGLMGFMIGPEALEKIFGKELSERYKISWTRANFPDFTPDEDGEDTFDLMAQRGVQIIDRVVIEQMGGGVDLERGLWYIPNSEVVVELAEKPE